MKLFYILPNLRTFRELPENYGWKFSHCTWIYFKQKILASIKVILLRGLINWNKRFAKFLKLRFFFKTLWLHLELRSKKLKTDNANIMTDYIKQIIKKYINFHKRDFKMFFLLQVATMNMILIFLPHFIIVGLMVSKSTLR